MISHENCNSHILLIFFSPAKEKRKLRRTGFRHLHTCSMHPQIMQDKPGNCSLCGIEINSGWKKRKESMQMQSCSAITNTVRQYTGGYIGKGNIVTKPY